MSPCRRVNPVSRQTVVQYMYTERPNRKQTTSSSTFIECGMLLVTAATVEVFCCRHRTTMTVNATRSTAVQSRNSDRSNLRTQATRQWALTCGVNKTSRSRLRLPRGSRTLCTGSGTGQRCQALRVFHKASRKSTRLAWMWTLLRVLRVR